MNKLPTECERNESIDEPVDSSISVQGRRPPDTLEKYHDTAGISNSVEIDPLPRKYARRTRLRAWQSAHQCSRAKESISCVGFRRFRSLSSDPEDQLFCEGLTNELVKAMQDRAGFRIAEIPVTDQQRLTFAGEREELKLNAVLVGKLRKTGERLRISVQLTNVSDGSVMWSEIYDRRLENAVAIQGEIARAIAQTIPICRAREHFPARSREKP